MKKIAVYGIGGHGREIASLIQNRLTSDHDSVFVGFIDDHPDHVGSTVNGATVFSLEGLAAAHDDAAVICGVGSPCIRQKMAKKCEAYGLAFAIISAGGFVSPLVTLGDGVVLCPGSIVTTNISIGRHVHVNVGSTISHDVVIGDYANINPGAHINGWVHLGERAYIGAGAVISNGAPGNPLVIGADAVVGAGACVLRSVLAGETVVGVPARQLRRRAASEAT